MKDAIIKYIFRHPGVLEIVKSIRSSQVHYNPLLRNILLRKIRSKYSGCEGKIRGVCIETILTCNARCVMCRHSFEKMTGIMDMDLFKKIIDDCDENGIRFIGMSIYGEPMLDKYFIEQVAYLRKYGMEYCFFTNGSLMTDEKARQLVEMGGLSLINFSINAYDPDVYKTVVGLDRETTYENILNFIRLKRELGADDMTISVSYVRCKENRHDFRSFVRFWKRQKGVDRIILTDQIKLPDSCDPAKDNSRPVLSRKLPCRSLWDSLNIYYDGKVAPCCGDNTRTLIVGDMNKQSLKEINQGEKQASLCRMHLADRRKEHPVCSRCRFDGF